MAITRAQLVKELLPGLNALFGLEYDRYDKESEAIFETESSDRAFEEEVMLTGFDTAPVKSEGAGVAFDQAQEAFTSRYTHETVALAFSITEEAVEDNLYDRLSARYTRALARSMANTKQIKGASVLNRAFNSSYPGGDTKELCATDHPTVGGPNLRNELSTAADLNETSLEQALIDIAGFVDERGLKVAVKGQKLIYMEASTLQSSRLNCLMLPSIILSACASVATGAVDNLDWGTVAMASLNAIISCLLAVVSYMKLDAQSEAHKISAHQYDKLQSSCEFT